MVDSLMLKIKIKYLLQFDNRRFILIKETIVYLES